MFYYFKLPEIIVVFLFVLFMLSFIYNIIFEIIYRFWKHLNKKYLKNIQDNYEPGMNYVGAVIPTSNLKWWHYGFNYGSGIMLLIESFKNRSIPFKVLTDFNRVFDKKAFKEMVFDPYCSELYVLGHGVRHGLEISKKEILFYCEFIDAPRKKKVVQLHCNHKGGKTLVKYLDADTDFETKEKRHVAENISYCLGQYYDSLKLHNFNKR